MLSQVRAPTVPAEFFVGGLTVCTRCGYYGKPAWQNKGSGVAEFLLWAFIISAPIGLAYSIWRRIGRAMKCPLCAAAAVIPASTPEAKQILAQQLGQAS